MRSVPDLPPMAATAEGRMRRVAIDMEFTGVAADAAADLLSRLFGGQVEEAAPRRFVLHDSVFGPFAALEVAGAAGHPLDDEVREALATVVASPPIPIDRLSDFERLTVGLRELGATGAEAASAHGSGLRLNPDAAAFDVDYVLRHLRAYLLLSDWLRGQIDAGSTRPVSAGIQPFPKDYALYALDPGYRPTQAQLIDDYIAFNPTWNRELDLLPLFTRLDEARVWRAMADPGITPRPAFCYRLPRTRLGDPGWSIVREWNRWVEVERLAGDADRLCRMSAAYRRSAGRAGGLEWLRELAGRLRRRQS